MKPYDEKAVCSKCLSVDLWTVYHGPEFPRDCNCPEFASFRGLDPVHNKRPEHLSRGCRRCHFSWTEAIAEAKP